MSSHVGTKCELTNREDDCFRETLALLAERGFDSTTSRILLVSRLAYWNAAGIGAPWVEVEVALTEGVGGTKSAYVSHAILNRELTSWRWQRPRRFEDRREIPRALSESSRNSSGDNL
jgi:hypothetical protein